MNERPGFYSVVRWVKDPGRDEAKNIGVIVVTADGRQGKMQTAPLGQVLPQNVAKQRVIDGILGGLAERVNGELPPSREELGGMHGAFTQSLQFTEPSPMAIVGSLEGSTKALYDALVRPPGGGGGNEVTSGKLVGHAAQALARHGFDALTDVERMGCHFDLVVQMGKHEFALGVLSFATYAKDWVSAEWHAGHYLFSLEKAAISGAAVVMPPLQDSVAEAKKTHARVVKWFDDSGVDILSLEDLRNPQRVSDILPV